MNCRNIVLIGMMGTGKSTVGQALAAQLGWRFVDTDAVIERNTGKTIPELFASEGEAYFREAEREAVAAVLQSSGQIVATGGGAVLREENREAMKEGGLVVALLASPEKIIERVRTDTNRPLLQGNLEERVHTLAENRREAYGFADLAVDTSELDVESIVDEIRKHAKDAS
ncbi:MULTISPECIES: shikimate kinase [Paenibacillus]|uniref:shikimate kinase n=1 Tax=Paenibacillus TaxID=44249 RepID=UPI0022B86275|nr:shikimate kinase [Paenibacillus caseinilyticus]MCZ8520261.1 shikimate kinase [Paenibacillus caseinilyticus]